MTTAPVQPRWAQFTDAELAILQAGAAEVMEDIIVAARRAPLPADVRRDAAGTMLIAARMSFEIDDHFGAEHPALEVFAETSTQIAAGTYHLTFAALMAGQDIEGVRAVSSPIDQAPRPLGPTEAEAA